jgi:hypothetical protein
MRMAIGLIGAAAVLVGAIAWWRKKSAPPKTKAVNFMKAGSAEPMATIEVPEDLWNHYVEGTANQSDFENLPQPFACEVMADYYLNVVPSGKSISEKYAAFVTGADKSLIARAAVGYGSTTPQKAAYCVALLKAQGRPSVWPKS